MEVSSDSRGRAGDKAIHRILIADDHPVTRSGISFLVADEPHLEVVGFACDGVEALALCEQLQPDLLLLDLKLPRLTGLVVIERLMGQSFRPRIVVISGQGLGVDFQRAGELGAQGLVSKEDSSEEMLAAINAVCSGRSYRSKMLKELLAPLGDGEDETGSVDLDDVHLTPREREILVLVAEGMSNAHVAALLLISVKTAKKHRENIRRKLGVSSAIEIARAAARLGLTNY